MPPRTKPRVLASRMLARSWRVGFFEDTLQYGDGRVVPYARLAVPDFAVAFAIREKDGKIPLVKQYRPAAKRDFWELPAGFVERGETPLRCIKREFSEEVGSKLVKPRFIACLYPSPARTIQRAYVFSGKIGKATPPQLDSTESLIPVFFSKHQAFQRLSERISSPHLLAFLLCVGGENSHSHGFVSGWPKRCW